MKIFVINGAAGSGKDTFVRLCRKFTGDAYLLNISTVDKVKEIEGRKQIEFVLNE